MIEVSLAGQVAIVTGGARGLGRTYVLDLARRGAAVVVNDAPDAEGLHDLVREIEDAGGAALAAGHSIATREGADAVVAETLERFGRLDILVNNAGILRNNLFEDLSDEQIDLVFAVHLRGAFNITQPAYRVMRGARYGRILNTSSSSAFGMVGLSNYAAAKAGIVGLTRLLALEAAEHGILVNALMPNAATLIGRGNPIPGFREDERFMTAWAALADRLSPELAAPLVGYLCSPACSLTGEIFSVLGGRYARVFFGVSNGWLSDPKAAVSASDVAEHIDEIMKIGDEFLVPKSNRDEVEHVAGGPPIA